MGATTDYLDDLDPDDPRTPSQQIANKLRTAIHGGKLPPGDKLPSQHDLASRYGVARETVKGALRQLDKERLIASRRGSGAYVLEPISDAATEQQLQELRSELDSVRAQLTRTNREIGDAERRLAKLMDRLRVLGA